MKNGKTESEVLRAPFNHSGSNAGAQDREKVLAKSRFLVENDARMCDCRRGATADTLGIRRVKRGG